MNTESCNKIIENVISQKITGLIIKNNQFNKIIHFQKLIETFTQQDSLIQFIFSNNQTLTGFDQGWKIIINLFSNTNKLKIINLSMSYVYDKYLEEIFSALKKKKITNLDLSSNFITISGVKVISRWLSKNKTLKYLNLEQNTMNEFKREGSDFIMEALRLHPRISYLNLSYMILTGFGEKMATMVKETKSLKNLKIRNTRMNLDDHKNLFSALLENESIEIIDIGENPTGVAKSVDFLSEAIEKAKKLMEINLDEFGINKKTQDLFLKSLIKNKILERIHLKNNNIDLLLLLDTLRQNRIIKEVHIFNKDYNYTDSEKEGLEKFKNERSDVLIYTSIQMRE